MRLSFDGWNWKTWLRKQISEIKLIIAAAVGLLGGYISTPPLSPELAGILAMVLTLVSRLLLDMLDYWLADDPQ